MSGNDLLSERELEILELVATGLSNRDISNRLDISVNTVKVHLKNVFKKLRVRTRTEAALFAVRNGYFNHQDLASGNGETGIAQGRQPIGGLADSNGEQEKGRLAWTISLVLVGILLLSLVGMFIAINLYDRSNRDMTQIQLPIELDRWESIASLPKARSDLAIVTYQNNIFVIGGFAQNKASDALDRYDPNANSWYSLVNKPTPVYGAGAAVIGGLIYVPGGETKPGQPTEVVEVYDPTQQSWTQVAPMPIPLSRYALAEFEGKLYLFGGWDGLTYVDKVFSYDPQANEWQEKNDMPTARGYAGAAVASGSIFVIGGFDGQNPLSTTEVYTPKSSATSDQSWEVRSSLPSPKYAMGVASIADIIYVVGGEGSDDITGILEYFPIVDEWISEDIQLKQPWSRMALTSLGTDLYAIGGNINNLPSSVAMRFKAIYVINLPLVQ